MCPPFKRGTFAKDKILILTFTSLRDLKRHRKMHGERAIILPL
jgi:hypothetical protein